MDNNQFLASNSPRLEFPNLPRWDCVSDYIQSKAFSAMDKIYPEFDVVRMDDPKNSLAMLEVRLQFTEKMLAQRRKNLADMRKDLDQQWKELDEKETDLRNSFKTFDAFVKENNNKRERAQKKINEDKLMLQQTRQEIEKCNKDYLEIKSAKHEMDQKIKEYRLYENYLNRCVDASKEFESSQELINRYLSLLGTKNYLAVLQENNLRALESAKSDMMKLIEEKNFILMGLNNQIAALQARFENAKIKSLECEQLVLQIKNNAVIKLNEIEEVKGSIWNVYCHMVTSKKHTIKLKKHEIEEQMLYVKRTLTEIAKVNQILRKRTKAGAKKEKKGDKSE
ncbi:unnamed protein product [Psylliodes chrysocephalus]|uniref:DUF4200 domain-containing protein n=1 Tax=Psylliodes chrysocephalus TaxID=3402493 RepID=A0A9P0D0F8_9CUCU|nr:unnamed protein product [Psylliodes chrysocephala]